MSCISTVDTLLIRAVNYHIFFEVVKVKNYVSDSINCLKKKIIIIKDFQYQLKKKK